MRFQLQTLSWLLVVGASMLLGQCSAWSETATPGTLRAIPLFSSKRANLEIEISQQEYAVPGGMEKIHEHYSVYLVDRSPEPALSQQAQPMRVYNFPALESYITPVACLDDQCNLYVLTQNRFTYLGGDFKVCCYNPYYSVSPAFRTEMIDDPERWLTILREIDETRRLPDGHNLFGEALLGRLKKVSSDPLTPESVREEQRNQLRQGLVNLLNDKLLSWKDNLMELFHKDGIVDVVNYPLTIQEICLVRRVDAHKSSPNDQYWDELRLINRIALDLRLLSTRRNVGYRTRVLPAPIWSTTITNPKKITDEDLPSYVGAPPPAPDKCSLRVTAKGVEFTSDRTQLHVILDPRTGKRIEP